MPDFTYEQPEETWGDYIDHLQAGAYSVGASYAAEARRRAKQAGKAETSVYMREWQNWFNDKVDQQSREMTPAGREIAQAAFGSKKFWESPVAWIALQSTNTLPSAAASIAPLAFGSNPVTLGIGAGLIGAQSSGSVTNDIQKQVDNQSDQWLRENIPQYAKDRMNGVEERQARDNLTELALGNKPFYAFIMGAATGGIGGPLAATARGLAGKAAGKAAEGGLLRTIGKEAGLGAISEGAQGATEEALTQGAQIAGGFQKDYDIGRIAQAGAGEGLVGGVLAGGAGGLSRVGRPKTTAETAPPSTAPPPPEIQQATEAPTSSTIGETTPPPQPRGTTVVQPTARATPFTPAQPLMRPREGIPEVWKGALPKEQVSGVTPRQTPGAIPEAFQAALGEKRPEAVSAEPEINRRVPGAEPTPPPEAPRTPFTPARPTPPRGGPTPPPQIRTPPRTPPGLGGAIPETGRTVLSDPIGPSPEVSVALSEKTQPTPPVPEEAPLIGNQRPGLAPPLPGATATARGPIPTPPPQIATPPRVGPAAPPVRPAQGVTPTMRQPPREMRPAPQFTPPAPIQGPPPAGPTREIGQPPVQGPPVRPPPTTFITPQRPLGRMSDEERAQIHRAREATTGEPAVKQFPGVLREVPAGVYSKSGHEAYIEDVNVARALREERATIKAEKDKAFAEGRPWLLEESRVLTGKIGKAKIAKREKDQRQAAYLFDKYTANIKHSYAATKDRVDAIINEANKLHITIPARVEEHTPDPMMWLVEVRDLDRAFKNGKGSPDHVAEFLSREHAAVAEGDFGVMRDARRMQGQMAKGVLKGEPETTEETGGAEGEPAEVYGTEAASEAEAEPTPRGMKPQRGSETIVMGREPTLETRGVKTGPGRILEGEERKQAEAEARYPTFETETIREKVGKGPKAKTIAREVTKGYYQAPEGVGPKAFRIKLRAKEKKFPAEAFRKKQAEEAAAKEAKKKEIATAVKEKQVSREPLTKEEEKATLAELEKREYKEVVPTPGPEVKLTFGKGGVTRQEEVAVRGKPAKPTPTEEQVIMAELLAEDRAAREARARKEAEAERERAKNPPGARRITTVKGMEYLPRRVEVVAAGQEIKRLPKMAKRQRRKLAPKLAELVTKPLQRRAQRQAEKLLQELGNIGTGVKARSRGARDFEAGKGLGNNPYILDEAVFPETTSAEIQSLFRQEGVKGVNRELIEATLSETAAERRAQLKALQNKYNILGARWRQGFVAAAQKAGVDPEAIPTKPPKPLVPKLPYAISKAPKAEAIKQKTVEQRRIIARTQIDKNATDAQRAAGNARGGLLNWQGLEVMLQYAKGMMRHGLKLQADYGHIKRTIGADGSPVDIYLGPNLNSDTVYVIDQVNPETGEFDEHKVMAGFDSEKDALFAHFSQVGSASQGDVTPMSMDQFKDWVYKDHSRKTAKREILRLKFPPVDEAPSTETTPLQIPATDRMGWLEANAVSRQVYGGSIRDWVNEWEGMHSAVPAGSQEAFNSLLNRIQDSIADTSIYTVKQEAIPGRAGMYDPINNVVVLREFSPAEGNLGRRTTLHEAIHAALVKATALNPALRDIVSQVATEFRAALDSMGLTQEFYAFKNADEFMAEFLSNPSMRMRLASTKASNALKNAYRAQQATKRPLRTLFDVVKRAIGRFFGLAENDTLLDTLLATASDIQATLGGQVPTAMTENELISRGIDRDIESIAGPWTGKGGDILYSGGIQDFAKGKIGDVIDRFRPSEIKQHNIWFKSVRGMDQLAQVAKDFGKPFAAAARQVANARERVGVRSHEIEASHDAYQRMWVDFQSTHKGTDESEKLGRYLLAETEARIRGDIPLEQQPHVGEGVTSTWARSQYPKLQAMWNSLSADSKALRNATMKLTADVQRKMALGILKNQIFAVLGVKADDAFVARLHDKADLTPAEQELLSTTSTGEKLTKAQAEELELAIKNTRALTSYKGPYYPEVRFGSHVVTGTYKFTEPTDAKRIPNEDGSDSDHEFEFASEDAAKAYAATQDPYTTIKSSYVDENGNTHYVDPDDDRLKRVTKEDAARRNFRVRVSNRVVEFFDSKKEAQDAAAEMMKDPNFKISKLGVREFNPDEDGGREFLAHDVRKLVDSLSKHPAYQDASVEERKAMKQSLLEMSLRFYGPTSIQSRRMPRRHVKGASIDFQKVMNQYISSSSGYLAKLEVQPDLDAGLKAMHANINVDTPGDGITGLKGQDAKQQIYNEMARRVTDKDRQKPPTNFDIFVNRIMAWTFINFLGSPAYSVNNGLQVGMVGAPHLASRHGVGATARMLYKVYRQVGVGKIVKAGARGMYTAATKGGKANFLEDMVSRLPNPRHKEMIEYLRLNGTIAPEAGLEFSNVIPDGAFGRATDIMQQIARSMPQAVETMNRVVMGVAAYDLEFARNGGNHQAAMEYAQEAVNLTQGQYSRTNMPTFFHKNALLSIAFQFKNYGQTIYGNIGHNIGKIIRNANPGDRAEAARALTYLAASHVIMAGMLGLPTEPIRWLLTVTNAVGATNMQWDEVENAARELNSYLFGNYGGELLSRGLPRAFGIDVSERLGSANLLTFGMPRDDTEESWMAYYGTMAAGATGGMVAEIFTGFNDIRNGDIAQGIQKVAPIKVLGDSVNAYRQFTEGKKTSAGYEIFGPVDPVEAFLVAFGYKPARQAEVSEASQYFYAAQRRVTEERNDLQRRWNKATGSEKVKMMKRIQDFNRGRPRDEQLTSKDLNNYAKSWRAKENIGGILINRRNRELAETLNIYNR